VRRRSNRTVLLLQRRSKHNDGKWGLPGGNAEEADASLLDTARREAAEEMGDVPDFEVTGVVETRSARLAARCSRGRASCSRCQRR
jgi:8-oxo-dGTP pyrophosphatase MutT (NUDIX family)